jgi:hypothetical protein
MLRSAEGGKLKICNEKNKLPLNSELNDESPSPHIADRLQQKMTGIRLPLTNHSGGHYKN